MNKETKKKIEEHFGWDFCDHDIIRRFCPECKLDVPAIWRKQDAIYYPEYKKQMALWQFN